MPSLIYGTAWKETATQSLTEMALAVGFRGIDTANQRRHYDEAAVGRAIVSSIDRGVVTRNGLFLQTKFTFLRGQDHRLPYDPGAPIPVQVEQSFASSLANLGVESLNCYLLHGPSQRIGLTPDDWAAWKAMEAIHDSGRVRMLGVSNVTREQLEELCQGARMAPQCVQNRCYASQGWDRSVREFCRVSNIVYQGFSLLTANTATIARRELVEIAKRHKMTAAQVVFRFAMQIGITPLTGTTNAQHMRSDLDVENFRLDEKDVDSIERLGEI
jgi:diketogulonate reductase-like aldo/keto reductase